MILQLDKRLGAICGLGVIPSVANFYLVSFAGSENKNAADAAQYLESGNIMPEPVNRPDIEDALRITVGMTFKTTP